jgi:transposase
MYLRTTQRKNRDGSVVRYYQLAQNERDPDSGQVTAKVLYNFGRADELDVEQLRRLCQSIARVCGATVQTPDSAQPGGAQADGAALPEGMEILRTVELGPLWVVEKLWERLGLRSTLEKSAKDKGTQVPYERAVLAMVANRLSDPSSKLGTWERWLPGVYLPGGWDIKLGQFYAAMDLLLEQIAEVEEMVFFRTANLFNLDVDVIFYDTTSAEVCVEFEDDGTDEEQYLRRWGRDKDGGSSIQVVIALAVTQDGLPVRSWVFPGNTTDSTTIERIRSDLRDWKLSRCLFLGDAGMNSEENRAELARACGRYVLAIRADGAEVREHVLTRRGRYQKLSENLLAKEVLVGEGERRRRYVLCYNPKEAERQKKRRESAVSALVALMDKHKKKNVRAKWTVPLRASTKTGPYLSVSQSGELYVDAEKIEAAGKLDGKWVLLTNDDTLSVRDIATTYRAAGVIERCFRSLKSAQIELRPMFHRLSHRIEAHVKLCVLALLIERIAERQCKRSWMRLLTSLRQLQATELRMGEQQFFRRNSITQEVAEILKTLEIQQPPTILGLR